jgi:eukaryotic-like serine/threonine-protein kinase
VRSRQPLSLDNGRYTVGGRLGTGNFGEVYLGHDTHQDVSVAIKLFGANVQFDQVMLEAQLQTRLSQHSRVASIRNVRLEPPRPFVVMDYYPAGSVHDRLRQDDVTLVEGIRWTRDALAGLGHAHALGIVHRDVKPSNWLLGPNDRAVISDFGLAEDTVRQVQAGGQIYWPHMAPEVPGAGTSPASDVWATGCTLYRLLTGDYPFQDPGAAARGDFRPPHRINPQIPMSLTRVVERALAVDPALRYASALDMLAAVNACRVTSFWVQVAGGAALEAWSAITDHADYCIELQSRPRIGFELRALRDLRGGAGFRTIRRERFSTVGRARQRLRAWLVELVEQGSL